MGDRCPEHEENDAKTSCVNCGREVCSQCVEDDEYLVTGFMVKCAKCDEFVCAPGDCCTDRGEGPPGIQACAVCAKDFCYGCLYEVDDIHRSADDDESSNSCGVAFRYVCDGCALHCADCCVACKKCYAQSYCCKCGGPLVGAHDCRECEMPIESCICE